MLLVFVYLIILFYFILLLFILFHLIVVSFSSICVFISLRVASVALALVFMSGRIPPLIGLPLLRSLLRSVFCAYSLFLLLFVILFVFSVYCLSRRCPVLATFLLVLFCLIPLLISKRIPGMIWLGSVYLVTTA